MKCTSRRGDAGDEKAGDEKGVPAHPTCPIVIRRPAPKKRSDASNHDESTDRKRANGLPEGEPTTHLNGLAIPIQPAISINLQQADFVHADRPQLARRMSLASQWRDSFQFFFPIVSHGRAALAKTVLLPGALNPLHPDVTKASRLGHLLLRVGGFFCFCNHGFEVEHRAPGSTQCPPGGR
jgi:hypothetical protein